MIARLISQLVERWLAKRRLLVLHRVFGSGIGDVLCMTGFLRKVHSAHGYRFIVITKYPDIFRDNPLVHWNIPFNKLGPLSKPLVKWFVRNVTGPHIGCFAYRPGEIVERPRFLEDHLRPVPLAQLYSEHLGWIADYTGLHNEIYFTSEIEARLAAKYNLPAGYAIIKPQGQTSWTSNKEWVFECFQEVIDSMPEIPWVQTGPRSDKPLSGVIDLRGDTTLRELFFLVRNARFVLATEGVYNHIAGAFETPSFVIFSGIHHPEIALNQNTVPILRNPQVTCAPCWILEPCPVPDKPCTKDISAEQVIGRIRSTLAATPQEFKTAHQSSMPHSN